MIEKSEVVVQLDGEQHSFTVEPDVETVLQAALDKDIDLPYSCMGGACSTCRCRLLEGEVEMDCNLILTDEEVEDGYVLACQSRPTTERIVLDFDSQD